MTDLSEDAKKKINDQYNTVISRLDEAKAKAEAEKTRQVTDIGRQWDEKIAAERAVHEQTLANAQKLAALTGAAWTATGVTSLDNILKQNADEIKGMEADKASMIADYSYKHDQIIQAYTDKVTDLQLEAKNAIENKRVDILTQIQKIDAEKGKTTREGIKELREVGKDYIDFIDKQYQRTFEKTKFEWDQAKFAVEQNRENAKFAYTQGKDLLDNLSKGNALAFTTPDDISNIARLTNQDE